MSEARRRKTSEVQLIKNYELELIVKNLNELPAAAQKLLPLLRGRGVVALYGGMGAGKTTLVSALVREMGSADDVTSPTFALVNDYLIPLPLSGGGKADGMEFPSCGGVATGIVDRVVPGSEEHHIYHFDFYRIDSPAEAFDLGYEEYFYSGEMCLVEWPEKIEELLPDDTLRIRIDTLPDDSRRISITNYESANAE